MKNQNSEVKTRALGTSKRKSKPKREQIAIVVLHEYEALDSYLGGKKYLVAGLGVVVPRWVAGHVKY